jgi:hypothetical protein
MMYYDITPRISGTLTLHIGLHVLILASNCH